MESPVISWKHFHDIYDKFSVIKATPFCLFFPLKRIFCLYFYLKLIFIWKTNSHTIKLMFASLLQHEILKFYLRFRLHDLRWHLTLYISVFTTFWAFIFLVISYLNMEFKENDHNIRNKLVVRELFELASANSWSF